MYLVLVMELGMMLSIILIISLRGKIVALTIYALYWIFMICWGSYMMVHLIPITAA